MEVRRAITVATEGGELAFATEKHFSGLVATTALTTDHTLSALDTEEVLVRRSRIL